MGAGHIHSLNLKMGKTYSTSDHSVYETEFGIPRIIAHLEDRIFEGLPVEKAKLWPEQFMAAVPVEADLTLVWPRFAVWLLVDETDGVIKFAKTDSQRKAIQDVADLYTRKIAGEEIDVEVWRAARRAAAAYAAAAYAAYAYAYAYAAAAAAAAAAAYAAYADAAAAAYADAARFASYERMAAKLIELLSAAS